MKYLIIPACMLCCAMNLNAQSTDKSATAPANTPTTKQVKFAPPKVVKDDFYNRNPNVKSVQINNGQTTVRLKDNSTEHFDLNNAAEKQAFITKYGALPVAPPPPPPPKIEPNPKAAAPGNGVSFKEPKNTLKPPPPPPVQQVKEGAPPPPPAVPRVKVKKVPPPPPPAPPVKEDN